MDMLAFPGISEEREEAIEKTREDQGEFSLVSFACPLFSLVPNYQEPGRAYA